MNMVKFYKKRGKAIWKRKFILQKKNGQSVGRQIDGDANSELFFRHLSY